MPFWNVNRVIRPNDWTVPEAPLVELSRKLSRTPGVAEASELPSKKPLEPVLKLRMSSSKLPALGSYTKGVVRFTTRSKALALPHTMALAVVNVSGPL